VALTGVYMHSRGILAGPSDVGPIHVPEGVQYAFPADESCAVGELPLCCAEAPRSAPGVLDKPNATIRLTAKEPD